MDTVDYSSGKLETWTAEEVMHAFEKNEIVLLDVRTPQEFMFEHVEGALLAPMSYFKPQNLPSQQGKQIVFHCGSGVRSEKVAKMCLDAGMSKVAHMAGGFGAWKQAKYAYRGTDMNTGAPKMVQQG